MAPAGFELAILTSERQQTDALDRAVTGIVRTYITKPHLSLQYLHHVYTIDNVPAIGFAHQTTGAVLCGHSVAVVLRTVDCLYITSAI